MSAPRPTRRLGGLAGESRAARASALLLINLACACSIGHLPPTPAPPDHRSRFRSCGWVATVLRPRELARVHGATVSGADEALPGFDSVEIPVRLIRSARGPRLTLYMALSA